MKIRYFFLVIILLISFRAFSYDDNNLHNQYNKEYLKSVKAIKISELKTQDDKYYYKEKLFTGVAYSEYDKKQLKTVIHVEKGVKDGIELRWYKDGKRMMEAVFKKGILYGHFRGWEESGELKYDLHYSETILSEEFEELDDRDDFDSKDKESD